MYYLYIKIIVLFVFVFVFVLSGCNFNENIKNPVPFDVGDEKIQEELIKKLEKEDIEYEIIDEISILVSKDDASLVLLHANQIYHSFLPFDRSTSLAQPYRSRFVELLERNNVQYEEVRVFNSTWIIWQEEDSDEVERLLEMIVD